MCSGYRRPAACFLATWHAVSRRHYRTLPSWMMLAVRLVCVHIQATSFLPTPDHLSASTMPLYLQLVREGEIAEVDKHTVLYVGRK